MEKSKTDNNVTVFRISDLLGSKKNNSDSLKKKTLISKKYNKNKDDIVMEVSSFKMSNKMTINGTGKKKKKTSLNKSDILWFHEEKLNEFRKMQESLPKKRDFLKSKKLSDNEKHILKKEIEMIENKVEETDYLTKTKSVIEKYKIASKNVENELKHDETETESRDNIMKYIKKYENVEKEQLAEEYCRLTNNGMMINAKKLVFENNKCEQCQGDTRYVENFVTCMECGCISENSIYDYQICYKDLCDTMIKKNYEYKRPNRFKEILASLQAKENTDIPQFVINAVREEIKKDYSRDILSIDVKKIKEYLKRLSLTSYYEHSPHILNSINGIPPVSIPGYIEEKLLEMFDNIQEPFEIVKQKVAPKRLSFLSYSFCLFKFCELLELDEYKKHFTLLKSVEKLRVQDKIWKGICEMLDWNYIPSI